MNGKRLYRNRKNQMLGGVCAGLADYFGMDATIMRLIFVVLLLSGSFGFWAYIILWIIVPVNPVEIIDPPHASGNNVIDYPQDTDKQ